MRFWKAGRAPYRGDPHYVTPLLSDRLSRWSPRSAFFEHGEARHFVAIRDGADVGRIAAAVDREHDRVHGDRTGFFGWFECEDSEETAHALLDAAAGWLGERNRESVRGPLSYTTNGISGLLVEDLRPGPAVIDMAYNPPYYEGLLTSWGLEPVKDLLAFWTDTPSGPLERQHRIAERLRERHGITLRPIRGDRKGFAADVDHVAEVYNAAWERNWGFVPVTRAEIHEQARAFRPILIRDLALLAFQRDDPLAFVLALPDMNQALAKIAGRLWPWSVIRLLLAQRKVNQMRVVAFGVLPRWRRLGMDSLLLDELAHRVRALGLKGGECSWVLEDNREMIRGIEAVGGTVYRRYRLYEKRLREEEVGRL